MPQNNHVYDYIIIGSGISGSCMAHELIKHSKNILVIEKGDKIASGASRAAGGFISPLLGKPNKLKDLVNKAFDYSTNFYKSNMPELINQCGTLQLAKNKKDQNRFKKYLEYIDQDYKIEQGGYFFKDASIVKNIEICTALLKDITIQYNYEVKVISFSDNIWNLDNNYYTKNIILATGASKNLISEFYLKTRDLWGQGITISSTTCISHNYHKECSVSASMPLNENEYKIKIGATHHRNVKDKKVVKSDTQYLLYKASDIIKLDNIKVIKEYAGSRASSEDYFAHVGKIINSFKTLEKFPSLKNGIKMSQNRFIYYDNIYILNCLGGRGFVLAPYLAKELSNLIINNIDVSEDVNVARLFKKEVRRLNNKNKTT